MTNSWTWGASAASFEGERYTHYMRPGYPSTAANSIVKEMFCNGHVCVSSLVQYMKFDIRALCATQT